MPIRQARGRPRIWDDGEVWSPPSNSVATRLGMAAGTAVIGPRAGRALDGESKICGGKARTGSLFIMERKHQQSQLLSPDSPFAHHPPLPPPPGFTPSPAIKERTPHKDTLPRESGRSKSGESGPLHMIADERKEPRRQHPVWVGHSRRNMARVPPISHLPMRL